MQTTATGDLARQITLAREKEAKGGRVLKGRQILKMVYEAHRLDEAMGQVFDTENVFSTTLQSDKLAKFLWVWGTELVGQGEPVCETILKPLLLRQLMMSQSPIMSGPSRARMTDPTRISSRC